ncbi:hypothetical protein FJZ31_18285 [Candidatus Poribacteria bacterium]|nr:hypothetical protein [Candidatus Poribacteria bacterium]
MKSNLLKSYKVAVAYPDVSGFEVLELLDIRSKLAELENSLTINEKVTLEQADEILLDNMEAFYGKIQEIGYLPEFRKRAKVLPSHWWWYMDKFINVGEKYVRKRFEILQSVEAVG